MENFTKKRGIVTHVVDVETIYNEYSSGNKDVTAIRRFINEIAVKGLSAPEKLSTVTLFGKPCVDYKRVNKTTNTCEDYIPTYETLYSSDFSQSFPTDDIYGLDILADTNLNDAIKTMAYGIGRLPVSSIEEARDVVNKIKKYKAKESYGDWRNQTTLVADDYDTQSDADFYSQNETVSKKLIADNVKPSKTRSISTPFFSNNSPEVSVMKT